MATHYKELSSSFFLRRSTDDGYQPSVGFVNLTLYFRYSCFPWLVLLPALIG